MTPTPSAPPACAPTWQCVLICWGTRYPVHLLNHLVDRIGAFAREPVRFVLLTDADKPDLRPDVVVRRMPEHWLADPLKRAGCQAKLAMFERGVLPDDLPAVYVDLDTVILGDLGAALRLMKDRRSVLMLHSAIIPFGPLGRLVWRLSGHRRYARGNSSIVVFHPAECAYIAERFRALLREHPDFGFRPMVADERFISWAAQPHMMRLPRSYVVKFPGEFMFPLKAWLYVRAALPWVRRRREGLAAITLNGVEVKPEALLALREGEELVDRKGRHLVWSDRTMGVSRERIRDFYAAGL